MEFLTEKLEKLIKALKEYRVLLFGVALIVNIVISVYAPSRELLGKILKNYDLTLLKDVFEFMVFITFALVVVSLLLWWFFYLRYIFIQKLSVSKISNYTDVDPEESRYNKKSAHQGFLGCKLRMYIFSQWLMTLMLINNILIPDYLIHTANQSFAFIKGSIMIQVFIIMNIIHILNAIGFSLSSVRFHFFDIDSFRQENE